MGSKPETNFLWPDVWILLSIALGSGPEGASIRDIIATGDYINHAILTSAELRRGLGKLLHGGHITTREDRFFLSTAMQDYWTHLSASTRTKQKRIRGLELFLAIGSSPESPDPPAELRCEGEAGGSYDALTEELYNLAYQQYLDGYQAR
ncbi:MAG: hypothetical protein JW797_20175 [Bradymonadales bacterium]|nr:hypothetical protein [Bradymonadales bacterium]